MSIVPTPASCFSIVAGVSAPLIIAGSAALAATGESLVVRSLIFVLVLASTSAVVTGVHRFTRTTPVPVREEVTNHA